MRDGSAISRYCQARTCHIAISLPASPQRHHRALGNMTVQRHRAFADADAEKWLQQLAKDVNIGKTAAEKTTADAERTTTAMESVTLYCDNQGAIKTIVSGTSKASTKHIDVIFHNSRHAHASGIINCTYIPTNENTADICTKALAAPRHRYLVD
jgi:hypothetical protein